MAERERSAGRYTPLHSSIWADPEFIALSANAQRVYVLAISQPNISYCGVVPFTEKRWARMARDTTTGAIADGVNELEDARFVVLDPDTEELWVRSFVKHNRVVEQKQLHKALARAFAGILSPRLQHLFHSEQPAEVKALLGSLGAALPPPPDEPGAQPAPGVLPPDLDLEPDSEPEREPEPSTASDYENVHSLAEEDCPPSFFNEADASVASLCDRYGPERVDGALRALYAEPRRFRFASQLRHAVTSLLGPPESKVEASPHDATLAAARKRAELDGEHLAVVKAEMEAVQALSREEREAKIAARRSGPGRYVEAS